jgi:ribosomal protein L12E/L44/L45/RPP1/RPP2
MNDDLTKSFDEYRVKELFEARPYFIDHLRLARTRRGASHAWTFVKKGGASVDATWTIAVDDGAPTAIEKAKVDALLTALNGLRIAESVEPAKASALAAPVLTASVSYDEGKFERVRVGQMAGTYIGRRDGEGVIGSVLASLVDGVDAALDAALAPAPAAPAAGTPPATQAPATAPPTPPTP